MKLGKLDSIQMLNMKLVLRNASSELKRVSVLDIYKNHEVNYSMLSTAR